jgi:hypothetical protein
MLVLAILAALWAIRADALRGLPDVGHPFDVAKYGTIDVPDDRNAFVDYAIAAQLLKRGAIPGTPNGPELVIQGGWAQQTPEVAAWLESNRPALMAWRRGTERPEAILVQPETFQIATRLAVVQDLREFGRLAEVEARRLESEGKMGEAWGWYRALLRSSRHVGRHGCLVERLVGIALHDAASRRIMPWAADPRVDRALLARALGDVIAADALTPPPSDALKAEYFILMNTFDNPNNLPSRLLGPPGPGPAASWGAAGTWLRDHYVDTASYTRQEPERSRRVIRLVWANWLAYCDLPRSKQPPRSTELYLYQITPDAPPAARALTPEALARWLDKTDYAKALVPAIELVEERLAGERSRQTTLVLYLAEQLYRRDHGGQAPPDTSALVGPYLKTLPDQPEEAPR